MALNTRDAVREKGIGADVIAESLREAPFEQAKRSLHPTLGS